MSTLQPLAELVTIGIATKNRWNDLKITLTQLVDIGLSNISVLILDDYSDQPCPFEIQSLHPNATIQRFESSEGYICRRNQLAQRMYTKYYLSLDDDSYPVAGSLQTVVEFAESHPELFCLSFPIFNPVLNEYQNSSRHNSPYQTRFFIGCGHLIRRDRLLQLGGYREDLIHQGEEMDIAARAFQQGFYCYHFPGFEIHHTASNVGRNWHRMDFYGARNNVLWNDWFVPVHIKPIKQARTTLSRLSLTMRVWRLGQLQGMLQALKDIPRYQKYRQPMSSKLYRSWQHLPHS
ncbi:MAG: glycosyltransferase family A protein [Oculatellaceae cyanobacterium bins.114]|nr:glycosyltransferase family A protein [Oculatellaceae cyanobacterium bins.114]